MNSISVLAPKNTTVESVLKMKPMASQDENILCFIQALSQYLLRSDNAKAYPELIALGFWLRKSNIQNQLNTLQGFHKALGVVVHFTPSNVDTMFVYSWVCALLMGNCNVVRVSSQSSELQLTLIAGLNQIMIEPQFRSIAQRNIFVQYERDSSITQQLSAVADARVIWGGDETVNTIRDLSCKPRCRDISFADRYSGALINGNELKSADVCQKLAELLWKDTLPYEQQACSSPRMIYWLGNDAFKLDLLNRINRLAANKNKALNERNNFLVVDQLMHALNGNTSTLLLDNISAIQLESVAQEQLEWHTGGGIYFIVKLDTVEQLINNIDHKLQTISYWGMEKAQLLKLLADPSITGIDRIVPIGSALNFSSRWDGFGLFEQLSRQITLE